MGLLGNLLFGVEDEVRPKRNPNKNLKRRFLESVNYQVNVKRDFFRICRLYDLVPKSTSGKPVVWLKNGWIYCVPFLEEQPLLTDEDIELFKSIYDEKRDDSLEDLQQYFYKMYDYYEEDFYSRDVPERLCNFERHYNSDLSLEERKKRANYIYAHTFWKDIAVAPAKIIETGEVMCRIKEVWLVKDYGIKYLDRFHDACVNECGFNKIFDD